MSNNLSIDQIADLVIGSISGLIKHNNMIPIGISARHVHVSKEDLERLFGKGYELTHYKNLSQPGQFAAQEKLDIIGPKGKISSVRILGPIRSESQVEVAYSDLRTLGVSTEVRSSGDIRNTPGITLKGPQGEITLLKGLIIAERHIHMTPLDAKLYGVSNGEKVSLIVEGVKAGVLDNITIRVSENYALDCHLDTDDANAFIIRQGQKLKMIKNKQYEGEGR